MGAERARLEKEIAGVASDLAKMNAKLENPSFMSLAKPEAIEETLERKAELVQATAKLNAALKRLAGA
jgi:valyl-tRNA synthetase